jgi:hypothetical protein
MATAGAALGLVFAHWMLGAIIAIAPEGLPRLDTVAIDLRVITFAGAAGLLTLLIFGIAPAFTLARTPVASVLAEGSRDGGVSKLLGQRTIVIAELALALVLLTGAHLFGETIFRLTSQPLGFDPKGLVVLSTTFTGNRLGDPAVMRDAMQTARRSGNPDALRDLLDRTMLETSSAVTERVLARLSADPGVQMAAGASAMPFGGSPSRVPVVLEGRPVAERHDALLHSVTERYFDTMRIQTLDGRTFGREDAGLRVTSALERPAVVSAEFQRRLFPEGALGRRFRHVYGADFKLSVNYRVIGVVADVKRQEFTDDARPAFYGLVQQTGAASHFVVRAAGDGQSLGPALRHAVTEASPDLVVTAIDPLEQRVANSVKEERFRATLSSLFGGAALLLAAVGLYGLMTRRAVDRRREFGVRVALGARPSDVGRLVMRDALIIVTLGLGVGLPAAYSAAEFTRTLLFGVTASSPRVFVMTAALLATTALAATLLPARRASRANPILALKE